MNFQTQKSAKQAGFTLIELVVVIVVLGILAATALPKFASLQVDARTATLKAGMGAVQSAVATSHGKFLSAEVAQSSTITLEGKTATNQYGYPKQDEIAALAGIDNNTTTEYMTSTVGTTSVFIYAPKASDTATCSFKYTEAANSITPATVNSLVATGC